MKRTFIIIILFLLCGVFGDEVKSVKVMSGDSVTLKTDLTDIQEDDVIWWRFGEGESKSLLAEIVKHKIWYASGRFRDKLQISDSKSGDLTIMNMKIKYSGLYEAEINIANGASTSYKRFNVIISASPPVIHSGPGDAVSFTVMEGESVTLPCNAQTQRDAFILWRFGDERALIAEVDIEDRKTSVYDGADGSFKDRLKLNDQTGDLTITDSKSKHSGLYQLKVSSNKQTLYKTFSVTVREAGLSSGGKAGLSFFFLLVIAAVIAAGWFLYRRRVSELQYEMKTVSVIEGKSVTLNTEMTEYDPKDHEILWRFGDKGHMIAQIHGKTNDVSYVDDERFKNKLNLDKTTGDLTITDFTIRTSGDYHMEITRSTRINRFTTSKTFRVVVHETLNITEGKSVELQTGISELQDDDQIQWRSEAKDAIIAVRNEKSDDEISINCDDDEMFKNRLTLDHKTGSLTINYIKNSDSGVYELQIKNKTTTSYKKINVLVGYKTLQHTVGDSVTLQTELSELKEVNQILWTFGVKNIRIAEINRVSGHLYVYDGNDERFRNRLTLNEQNGDLTIRNIMRGHSDVYKLQINSRSESKCKSFMLTVNEKLTEMPVMEGESVRLPTDLTHTQNDDQILWMFGPEESLIAKFYKKSSWKIFSKEEKMLYDGVDGRFKNKLDLDQTGSLTIRDINTEHTGLYKLQIIRNGENTYKKYKVCVDEKWTEMSVMEGESVRLPTDLTDKQNDDQILWMFGPEDSIITKFHKKKKSNGTDDKLRLNDGVDLRFKNKLDLDQTGSLTIRDINTELTGLYKLQIISNKGTNYKKYKVSLHGQERESMRDHEMVSEGIPLLPIQTSQQQQPSDVINKTAAAATPTRSEKTNRMIASIKPLKLKKRNNESSQT
ncbi:uncharacterized protein [Paramisgurnus dabryanus]|uniref:uncharacterized protein isoform X2 n=1 Tax=Paramisgurnus dabryanus TaxID=90735 RepID=UPI0031F3D0E3